jgi:hypothetical protein
MSEPICKRCGESIGFPHHPFSSGACLKDAITTSNGEANPPSEPIHCLDCGEPHALGPCPYANPPAVAAKSKQCDHKFIDSRSCVKCGWMPPDYNPRAIEALTDEELEDAAIALDNFAEFLAEDDEIGPSKALATKLRGMKGRG